MAVTKEKMEEISFSGSLQIIYDFCLAWQLQAEEYKKTYHSSSSTPSGSTSAPASYQLKGLQSESISFTLKPTIPDGDCFFHAVDRPGFNRITLVEKLLDNATRPEVRTVFAQEICQFLYLGCTGYHESEQENNACKQLLTQPIKELFVTLKNKEDVLRPIIDKVRFELGESTTKGKFPRELLKLLQEKNSGLVKEFEQAYQEVIKAGANINQYCCQESVFRQYVKCYLIDAHGYIPFSRDLGTETPTTTIDVINELFQLKIQVYLPHNTDKTQLALANRFQQDGAIHIFHNGIDHFWGLTASSLKNTNSIAEKPSTIPIDNAHTNHSNVKNIGEIKTYNADKTAESGHPNADSALNQIAYKILGKYEGKRGNYSLEQLHIEIYDELLKQLKVTAPCKYNFKYEFSYWEGHEDKKHPFTDNFLLLFIVINEPKLLVAILKHCSPNLLDIVDSNGNNALHLAAFYKRHEMVFVLLSYSREQKFSEQLLNARNLEGTNSLGMFFINDIPSLNKEAILKALINAPEFEINSYLNNRVGMDVFAPATLKRIGGMNCLHWSLKERQLDILQELSIRDKSFKEKLKIDNMVNFRCPAMNPDYHMWSPARFNDLKATNPQAATERENIKNFYDEITKKLGGSDSSGDSDTKGTSAWHYKQELINLTAVANDDLPEVTIDFESLNLPEDKQVTEEERYKVKENIDNLVVAHFHGVPFMQGHYFDWQRREIGMKMLEINKNNVFGSPPKSRDLNTRGIHSRTSMATAGIGNLHRLIKAADVELEQLTEIDRKLSEYLKGCWLKNPSSFLSSLGEYIYRFDKEPTMRNFWGHLKECDTMTSQTIVKYRFPNVSTSKTPDHPIRFGFGINTETQARGERPLAAKYDGKSFPKHRLAGLLYVTLHSLADILKLQNEKMIADVPQLLRAGVLKTTGQGSARINFQLEVNFFGGISGENVVAVIPLLYPNLAKEFNEEYHSKVWGFVNKNKKRANYFDNAKKTFSNCEDPAIYEKGDTTSGLILMPLYLKLAMNVAQNIARKGGKKLCSISPTGDVCPYVISVNKTQSEIQGVIAKGTPTSQNQPLLVTPDSQKKAAFHAVSSGGSRPDHEVVHKRIEPESPPRFARKADDMPAVASSKNSKQVSLTTDIVPIKFDCNDTLNNTEKGELVNGVFEQVEQKPLLSSKSGVALTAQFSRSSTGTLFKQPEVVSVKTRGKSEERTKKLTWKF